MDTEPCIKFVPMLCESVDLNLRITHGSVHSTHHKYLALPIDNVTLIVYFQLLRVQNVMFLLVSIRVLESGTGAGTVRLKQAQARIQL